MSKIKNLYGKIVSTKSTEGVKTWTEFVKAFLDFGKTLKENRAALPAIAEISSLLEVIGSPLAMVAKDTIPFAPLVLAILQQFKHELSFEECVVFLAHIAYLESWRKEFDNQPDWLEKVDKLQEVDQNQLSTKIAKNLLALGEMEINEESAKNILHGLPSSKLVVKFNEILVDGLQELGVEKLAAQITAERVAQYSPRYLHGMLAENYKKIEVLAEFYKNGGIEVDRDYASIDEYLQEKVQPLPEEQVFDEENPKLTLKDIYVHLNVQPLEQDGKKKQVPPISIETWAIDQLLDPMKSGKILFIQGEAGRGKSAFCRMFADYVRCKLPFTPILIRLRDLPTVENNFTRTLETFLETPGFVHSDWLKNKNQRFLFLLDGFDELLLEGRINGGLKDFLGQVERFQEHSHHRCLITGRPLALQGLERLSFWSDCLERVELMKMNNHHHDDWMNKWEIKFGQTERQEFEQFLKACQKDIYDRDQPQKINTNLVGEPLMLYLLGRMHREKAIQSVDLADVTGLQAKVKIYDSAVDWVLNQQRNKLNQQIIRSEKPSKLPELRQFLRNVSLCVVQSGAEIAKVSSIESRILKDPNHPVQKLFEKITQTNQGSTKALNTFLTTFYIQPATSDKDGSVEFAHKSFGEFLFAEHVKEAITDWSSSSTNRRGVEDQIKQENLEWQIYDLLGYSCLTPEIVGYLWAMLESSDDWFPIRLFQRLNGFWKNWCEGTFIDHSPNNLPQKKMLLLKDQMPERGETSGIRQVDIYTGLNVLILLLNLHHYAQTQDSLKGQIIFYPNDRVENSNELAVRFLKVIHYSESIGLGLFNKNIVSYLSGIYLGYSDLKGSNLSHANLHRANLKGSNLSRTDLRRADLSSADLSRADFSGASLSGAYLSHADLRGSNLSSANLSSAYLSSTNLSNADFSRANLSSADIRDADFSGADLSSANLSSADLRGANLSSTDLSRANLSSADIRDTDLSGVNLSGANLTGIIWNTTANWQEVKGLGTTIYMPADLKKHLGLL
jgi:uncharacterized protein YjbI with pentapeptide repeats